MSLDTPALDHICSVVRRSVQEEIQDLTLLYIAHNTGTRGRALKSKIEDVLEHPAGETLLPLLKKMAEDTEQHSVFAGLAFGEKRTLLGLRKHRLALAVFFINSDEFTDQNDARQHAYHVAWQALSLSQKYKAGQVNMFAESGGVIRFRQSPVAMARQNLLGDVFSAVLLEKQGHKKAINALAYKRSLMALQAVPHYKAEQYPFPIAADAVGLVYDEMKDSSAAAKPVAMAMEIANEIDYTYDDTSIRQWWEFSMAAQEMAWLNFDKTKILSTAIYTSEDPYVRSTAYLVAEALNMEPAALSDLGSYNPFTDQEVNERLHVRACDESFQAIAGTLAVNFNEHLFDEEIRRQNQRLMEGFPIGWCGHGLLMARDALELVAPAQNPVEAARQAFIRGCKSVAWETLRTVCRMAMSRRRDGEPVTPEMLIEFCQDKEALSLVAGVFAAVEHQTPAGKGTRGS